MKTLHNPIIIGVVSSVLIGGVILLMFQTIISGPVTTPDHTTWKIYQTTPVFEELRNITGIAAIQNQTYYFTTLNDTMISYHQNPLQMSFHGVVFTFFPSPPYMGPVGMCSGFTLGADAKFSDGIHELLRVPVLDKACAQNHTKTDLSNHTNPQAGLLVYEGKVKLLVSTNNQTIEKKFSALQPDPFNGIIPNRLVFLMKQNSTLKIYVKYVSDQPGVDANATELLEGGFYTGDPNNFIPVNSSKLIVTSNPYSISIRSANLTAVYTITAQNITPGIYWIYLTQICEIMPVAIGVDGPQISPSDIPVWNHHCPAIIMEVQILGVAGGIAEYKPSSVWK